MMSVSLCNNNNRNTDYLYTNFAFLNVAILSSKPLLALRCRLDLVFSCTGFFYQRSSFALLTTMSSEMYQWQSFLCRALASAQFFAFFSLR